MSETSGWPQFSAGTSLPSFFYLTGAFCLLQLLQVVPHIKDLITNSNCNFSVSEITRMEAVILKKLKWDLCRATALDFLHGVSSVFFLNGYFSMGSESNGHWPRL